jgi:catechol 2,3-dioxygenase-like lactoylglutathione lyase family enzyme
MSAIEVLRPDNVLFWVDDYDSARRFYSEVLGLRLKFEVGAMGLAGFRLGEEEPGLFFRAGGAGRASGWRLPTRGRRPESWAPAAWSCCPSRSRCRRGGPWSSDPSGNVLGLTDYTKRPDLGRPPAG